jgi:hypothetical protein
MGWMQATNEILIFIFVSEAALKILARGFLINGKRSYLRDSWNCFDFFVVIVSIVPYCLSEKSIYSYETVIFTFLNVLKPLRIVSRSENLKVSLVSLLKAIKGIGSVVQMSLLFFSILSIVAINFMKGTFHYCDT